MRLVSRVMAQVEGAEDFSAYARRLQDRFPIRLSGDPVLRIRDGAICLNDPSEASVCLATFRVSRRFEELVGSVAISSIPE